jgi:predicted ribonuclease YlaK
MRWNDQVKRIILTRPAVEAGERLGFLPGDLSQKSILIFVLYTMRCMTYSASIRRRNCSKNK